MIRINLALDGVLDGSRNVLYAAPTSAGKTLVSEIIVATRVTKSSKAMLIFPFISLAQEKYNTLKVLFRYTPYRIGCFAGGNKPSGKLDEIDILVCTIEKSNSLLNYFQREGTLDSIGCVVIDEIHLIGEGQRGFLLELICAKLLRVESTPQIVGMSATVPNLEQLGRWLNTAVVFRTDYRPVPLTVNVCLKNKLFGLVNGKQKMVRVIEEDAVMNGLEFLNEENRSILALVISTLKQEYGVEFLYLQCVIEANERNIEAVFLD